MNDRMWCPSLDSWVRVLETRELFGRRVATVWPEGGARVHQVPCEALVAARPFEISQALSSVAGARIWSALGSDLFFAPLVSRVIPLPHQVRVLRRALDSFPVRLLLADEVGLGKTVEAGLIMKELKLRGMVDRVLVLAPKSLLLQWVFEMEQHFREPFHLVEPGAWGDVHKGTNPWSQYRQVVTSVDAVKPKETHKGWTAERLQRYNLERFSDLVGAGWDLVIIDEAHKVAGSGDGVARHELAKGLARVTPNLLLLSATPHSGKSDAFRRLLSLLDPGTFPDGVTLGRDLVAPFVIRTEKRTASDNEGKPLFSPRTTSLVKVPFQRRHHLQQLLYEEVSTYVVEGYNQAQREGNSSSRLLLILIQRLVSSSTRAIARFLERRLEVLTGARGVPLLYAVETVLDPDVDLNDVESEALHAVPASGHEIEDVRRLLDLALQVEHAGPDARAEALYDEMVALVQQDSEPGKKFLVFTEFMATQEMLEQFLEQRGYSVELLNGTMNIEERKSAQDRFRDSVQLLISTEAGGEGLNLQFAHVVFNYDLPWNPMRLEQRIGRVDRIGQVRPVKALNLVLENSVEARIYEVLQEKLATILREFGVDKTTDVLDSEAGAAFEQLARTALLKPESFDSESEGVFLEIRKAAVEARNMKSLYDSEPKTDKRPATVPLRKWLSTLLRDGPALKDDASDLAQIVLSRIESLRPLFGTGKPVPRLKLEDLGFGLDGWFAIWKVGVADGAWRQQHVFAMFVTDSGDTYNQSAQRVWDALAARSVRVVFEGDVDDYDFATLENKAEQEAKRYFDKVVTTSKERLSRRLVATMSSYQARLAVIERIGLPNVRAARKRDLEAEQIYRREEATREGQLLPHLQCLMLARVVAE